MESIVPNSSPFLFPQCQLSLFNYAPCPSSYLPSKTFLRSSHMTDRYTPSHSPSLTSPPIPPSADYSTPTTRRTPIHRSHPPSLRAQRKAVPELQPLHRHSNPQSPLDERQREMGWSLFPHPRSRISTLETDLVADFVAAAVAGTEVLDEVIDSATRID